jgi:glycosyltransferase involved in cell wall biosynthesis
LLITDLFPHRGRPHHGGSVRALVEELGRQLQVTVMSPRYFSPLVPRGNWLEFYRGQPARVALDGVTARYPLTPAWPHAFYTIAQGFSMSAAFTIPALRDGPFDLVHAFGVMPPGMPGAWISRVLRVPFVTTATGSDVTFFPNVGHVRPWVRRVLRRARTVTAVSRDLCGVVERLGARAEFIPMGIPRALADVAAASGPREPATVLYLGRLEPWKGAPALVEAMRSVPGARLVIIGEGSLGERLRASGATLTGPLPTPEVHAWLRRATVLCMPSEREGWPVAALEALACGLPIVATRVGGLPEIVADEGLGLLCEPRDPAALAVALRSALARPWDRRRLVAHATQYAWDRIAGRYVELYGRCAGNAD